MAKSKNWIQKAITTDSDQAFNRGLIEVLSALPDYTRFAAENVRFELSPDRSLLFIRRGAETLASVRPNLNGNELILNTATFFLKLPLSEKQRIMKEQAESMLWHYKDMDKNKDLETGDFYSYG